MCRVSASRIAARTGPDRLAALLPPVALVALATAAAPGAAATGTLCFEHASPVQAGATPIDLGSHCVTRLVDWDRDGDLDLLVGAGDGHVWLFVNAGTPSAPLFGPGEQVSCAGQPLQAGTGSTTACLLDATGDDRRDLLVGYGRRVRLYPNVGTDSNPYFGSGGDLEGATGAEFLTPGCNGRLDAGDWDGDGRVDLWCGDFDGAITYTAISPAASRPTRTGS